MPSRMFLPAQGTVWSAAKVAKKIKGHLRLVSSQNSVLKGNITMDTLLSAIDCSQPFQVVADLKLRQVFTMITSRGAATLLLHTMDLASPATFQSWLMH